MPDKESKCNCCLCGEPLAKSKYYKSYSEFYKEGHLPICKECFGIEFGKYAVKYNSNKKSYAKNVHGFRYLF